MTVITAMAIIILYMHGEKIWGVNCSVSKNNSIAHKRPRHNNNINKINNQNIILRIWIEH